MKIVLLNGKPYAVNLWWQVRPGLPAEKKAMLLTARETARELQDSYDAVVLRPNQYGLGSGKDVIGLPSLAAAIRPQSPLNLGFLGLFRLHEGWWVCGISRGAIAASGDRLFADEGEARAHLRQLRDLFGTSEEVIRDTPDSSEVFLDSLTTADALVESLFPDPAKYRNLLRMGLLAGAMLLAAGGGKWLWDQRAEETVRVATRQLMQGKESRRREILADPGRYFEKSWLAAPAVTAVRDLCLPELLGVPLSSNGWALESAICRPNGLSLSWGHRPGAAYTRLPQDARLENPKKAGGVKKLRSPDPRQTDAPLLTREAVTSRLYETTRQLGCRLKLNWSSPEKTTVEEVEVTAPWVRGAWQLEAVPAFLLEDTFALLAMVPGLAVSEVRFENSWTIKGGVHATLK